MARTHAGTITQWNDSTGRGLIREDAPRIGVHPFGAGSCSTRLLTALSGRAIPPGEGPHVTFDVLATNVAVNVDLG
jgi:hypothetical protein